MREIKFRAWNKTRQHMENGQGLMVDFSGGVWEVDFLNGEFGGTLDEYELNCWTGLKDRNDKEIYEGDIVEYEDICSDAHILQTGEKEQGVITWIERKCQLMPQEIRENHKGGHYLTHWDFLEGIEIIGNIYENPDIVVR